MRHRLLISLLVIIALFEGYLLIRASSQRSVDRDVSPPVRNEFPDDFLDTKQTDTYGRLKRYLDGVRAIDTHDHLEFESLSGLFQLWRESYFGRHLKDLGGSQHNLPVEQWWEPAQAAFDNGRATCFYRYQLPALQDLYGVDFRRLTLDGARQLDEQIRKNYEDPQWIEHVVTERANIELVLIDYDHEPYDYDCPHDFGVFVMRVNPLVRGFHPDEYDKPIESPYYYAAHDNLPLNSLKDYVEVLDHIVQIAMSHGAVGMKSTLAYQRTLHFERVTYEEAAQVFGKRRSQLEPRQIKAFEDFVFWRLCELSAKYDLPFQIHTGAALERSNPLHLEKVLAAHSETRFILFHGGFPWVGETGAILLRFPDNVWIDSNWLPTLSYVMAKRAYHEWLDVVPANRIMWGTDVKHAEGIYAAAEITRQCLAEVLAERVIRGELFEDHAERIGRLILRENALEVFPRLSRRLK